MLNVGLHWSSLLLSMNMGHILARCLLCCFHMLPARVKHLGALMAANINTAMSLGERECENSSITSS